MHLLLRFSVTNLLIVAFSFVLSAQVEYCQDPEAWNPIETSGIYAGPCIYLPQCDPGFQPVIFEPSFIYSSQWGSEFHLISVDLQDTIISGITEGNGDYFVNFRAVCIDPELCYYFDMYPISQNPGFYTFGGPFVSIYPNEFGAELAYYSSHPGPADMYRVSFAPDSTGYYNCGILGCTDPIAMNYWAQATEDYNCEYCDNNTFIAELEQVMGEEPVSYQIVQGDSIVFNGYLPQPNGLNHELICLPDGCYELRAQGDPWYFHKLRLYELSGDTLATVSLSQNEPLRHPFAVNVEPCDNDEILFGCTNPLSLNYDPDAEIYDGTCDLQNDGCSLSLEATLDTLNGTIQLTCSIYSIDYPWLILVDFGDGSPLIEATPNMTHEYTEPGVYEVCATIHTIAFFDQVPLCYDGACVTFDAENFGMDGSFSAGFTEIILSSQKAPNKVHFDVFPNPAGNMVTVRLPDQSQEATYTILTIEGRVVISGPLNDSGNQIDVRGLSGGLYFIQVKLSDGNYASQRLIVDN